MYGAMGFNIGGRWEFCLLLSEASTDIILFLPETHDITTLAFPTNSTTTEPTPQATNELDRTVILGGSLGALLLILVAGITILLFIVILKKKS